MGNRPPPSDDPPHPLTAYRRRHRLTLATFAARVAVSVGNLSKIERRLRCPRVGLVRRMVAATGGEVSAADIIDATVAPAPEAGSSSCH